MKIFYFRFKLLLRYLNRNLDEVEFLWRQKQLWLKECPANTV